MKKDLAIKEKKDRSNAFNEVFNSPKGLTVLDHIRDICEIDSLTELKADDRLQVYYAGKASIYSSILEILAYNKKESK